LHVSGAFGLDHVARHAQPDRAVGRTSASGDDVVGVLGGDLVAEEPRRAGAGVGDQRLCLGQLQLEVILQELSEATLISSASAFGPANPSRMSSAYLT
jgi:hypothetical protein